MKRALLILALAGPASGEAEVPPTAGTSPSPAEAGPAPPLVLEPMVVYGETKLAFGFGLKVTRIERPRVVLEMLVDRVLAGSDAERKGLRPGSRVVSIDGKEVSDYEATFAYGSELNRIFIDRRAGARVTLQVLVPGRKKLQKLTIVRRTALYDPPVIGGLPLN